MKTPSLAYNFQSSFESKGRARFTFWKGKLQVQDDNVDESQVQLTEISKEDHH